MLGIKERNLPVSFDQIVEKNWYSVKFNFTDATLYSKGVLVWLTENCECAWAVTGPDTILLENQSIAAYVKLMFN